MEKVMSTDQDKPSANGMITEELHHLEEKVESFLHPTTQDLVPATAEESAMVPVTEGELPNVASPAENVSVGDIASSALIASLGAVTLVAGDSVSAVEKIKGAISAIKQHLDINHFEQSTVAEIHAQLAVIESFL